MMPPGKMNRYSCLLSTYYTGVYSFNPLILVSELLYFKKQSLSVLLRVTLNPQSSFLGLPSSWITSVLTRLSLAPF